MLAARAAEAAEIAFSWEALVAASATRRHVFRSGGRLEFRGAGRERCVEAIATGDSGAISWLVLGALDLGLFVSFGDDFGGGGFGVAGSVGDGR